VHVIALCCNADNDSQYCNLLLLNSCRTKLILLQDSEEKMLLACSGGSSSWSVLNVGWNNKPLRLQGGTICVPVDSAVCG
jgi:hypothetical protein